MSGALALFIEPVIEHKSDAYDANYLWCYKDAISRWVASAYWYADNPTDVSFSGPSKHKICTQVLCGESDDLEELRYWSHSQISKGAHSVSIYETWPIILPGGKEVRDNAFRERVACKVSL